MSKNNDNSNSPLSESFKNILANALMVGSLAGLGLLGWYAYKEANQPKETAEIPVITGDNSPFKIEPKNPEGMKFANEDTKVLNLHSGEGEATEEAQVKEDEQPVDIASQETPPASEPVPSVDESTSVDKPEDDQEDAKAQPIPQTPDSVQQAEAKPLEEDTPVYPVVKLSSIPDTPEEKKLANLETAAGQPSEKVKTTTEPKREAKKEASKGGSFSVQLGSFKDEASLKKEWAKLQKKFPKQLSGLKMQSKNVDLGEKGKFIRLYATGLKDKASAASVCKSLSSSNQGCIVR